MDSRQSLAAADPRREKPLSIRCRGRHAYVPAGKALNLRVGIQVGTQ
jgi:hypothetical protein